MRSVDNATFVLLPLLQNRVKAFPPFRSFGYWRWKWHPNCFKKLGFKSPFKTLQNTYLYNTVFNGGVGGTPLPSTRWTSHSNLIAIFQYILLCFTCFDYTIIQCCACYSISHHNLLCDAFFHKRKMALSFSRSEWDTHLPQEPWVRHPHLVQTVQYYVYLDCELKTPDHSYAPHSITTWHSHLSKSCAWHLHIVILKYSLLFRGWGSALISF